MKTKILLLACGLLLLPEIARADVATLLNDYDGPQPNRTFSEILIVGIAEGFDTINAELKQAGSPPLFCSPVKMKADQLIEILRKWIDANRAKSQRIEKAPPGPALLRALTEAFPCKK